MHVIFHESIYMYLESDKNDEIRTDVLQYWEKRREYICIYYTSVCHLWITYIAQSPSWRQTYCMKYSFYNHTLQKLHGLKSHFPLHFPRSPQFIGVAHSLMKNAAYRNMNARPTVQRAKLTERKTRLSIHHTKNYRKENAFAGNVL